jgi:hypothetical protein
MYSSYIWPILVILLNTCWILGTGNCCVYVQYIEHANDYQGCVLVSVSGMIHWFGSYMCVSHRNDTAQHLLQSGWCNCFVFHQYTDSVSQSPRSVLVSWDAALLLVSWAAAAERSQRCHGCACTVWMATSFEECGCNSMRSLKPDTKSAA